MTKDIIQEKWLDVPGYEGRYKVSDQGRVRSVERFTRCINKFGTEYYQPVHGRILTSGCSFRGRYQAVTIYKKKQQKRVTIHRLVLAAFVGPCPYGLEGSHLNGNDHDNRLSNLVWETKKQNHARKIKHGTAQRGERCSLAILKESEVREIRRRFDAGESAASIQEDFSVSYKTIFNVARRLRWAWLDN